jgi:hypothetical protein
MEGKSCHEINLATEGTEGTEDFNFIVFGKKKGVGAFIRSNGI